MKNFSSEQIDATRLIQQGIELHQNGQYSQAESRLTKAIELRNKLLGENNPLTLTSKNYLAMLYYNQGRFELAELQLKDILAVRRKLLGDKHPDTLISVNNLGQLYRDQRRFQQAEPLLLETLYSSDDLIGNPLTSPLTVNSLNILGRLYQNQGRYSLAEVLFVGALKLQKTKMKLNPSTIQKLQKGIIHDKELNDKNPYTLAIINNLAELFSKHESYEKANPLLNDIFELRKEVLGENHPDTLSSMNNLAMSNYGTEQGETLLKETLRLRKEVLGDKHPDTLSTMSNLALLYRDQERYQEALSLIRQVDDYYKSTLPKLVDGSTRTILIKQNNNKSNLIFHVGLIDDFQQQIGTKQDLTSEGFEYAQLVHSVTDAQVVTQMALVYAANNPKFKILVEKLRDAVAFRNQLNQEMSIALSNIKTKTYLKFQASIDQQSKIDVNEENIKIIDNQLKKIFPAYNKIINPTPIPLADVQKYLGKDEALLVYVISEKDNYVFVVKNDKAVLRHLYIGKYDPLQEQIKNLRCAFYRSCNDGELLESNKPRMIPEPFDINLAHHLYQQLIVPIEDELSDTKHLLTVADGALHSLPFQLLVKNLPPDTPKIGKFESSRYREVDWLIKHYSFSALPSVKSLAVLRGQPSAKNSSTQPFIGFGDPEFKGTPGSSKGMTAENLFRSGLEGQQKAYLIDLPRLQETAAELEHLAQSLLTRWQWLPKAVRHFAERLGFIDQAVFLQRQASESEVKRLSAEHQLSSQVLAFSTHGLLAHEAERFGVVAQAGLVLPDTRDPKQDGLLTGSEISQLNLNADWIVLSACNTATPDAKSEASGLSELAKAFFLKGSRSILASHWYVNSATTQDLMTDTFARLRKDPQLPRAEALRQSMLSVLNGTNEHPDKTFAHPLYWAPFVIMGEGGV